MNYAPFLPPRSPRLPEALDEAPAGFVATANDPPPPLDWQGVALDCAQCPSPRATARCQLGHACAQDRYARRIDRYFRWNPLEADRWLTHPYFEVRAIAARHASVFRLNAMIDDPDETVRLSVAVRLPANGLQRLLADPHREVRIRVAMRIEPTLLSALTDDPDYYVRLLVARRLPLALLPRMAADADREVRLEVAARLPMPALLQLADDREAAVRRVLAERLPAALLGRYRDDPAWDVRWQAVQRGDAALAQALCGDTDPEVRAAARARLQLLADAAASATPTEPTHG